MRAANSGLSVPDIPPPAVTRQASGPEPAPAQTIAAVDLGSNSFHMIVAETSAAGLQVIDRLRETVRLAAGLGPDRRLTEAAMETALQSLERFGQRLREIPRGKVRAVGTNTLRQARNAREFAARAREALGHPVDIVAGREEARLIYLGVAHSVFADDARRLVVDIGGGSTELIIGQGLTPLATESLFMGCVGMSEAHFGDGVITAKRMRRAVLAARQELESIEIPYRDIGWESPIGGSGTILAVAELLERHGWCKQGITAKGLNRVRKATLAAGRVGRLPTLGLSPERAPVFAGGLAILLAVFEAFGLEHMSTSPGALREGLLYDLLGRIHDHDIRDTTVAELVARYGMDRGQADRVAETARACLAQLAGGWQLDARADGTLLGWAAALHEIGLAIAHNQYHKHGAYLLKHLDMPGFSREDQMLLAALVRGHRRKLPVTVFNELGGERELRAFRLAVILRLAALLHRSRSVTPSLDYRLLAGDSWLAVSFPPGWLAEHPLTEADLAQEATYLAAAGFELRYG